MEGRKIVFQETAIMALGQTVCIAAMMGVFALLGFFDRRVVLGGIAGGCIALLNFFLMAVFASLAADKAQAGDAAGGQKLLKATLPIRLLLLAVLLFAFAKSGAFQVVALVLPLVFVQPILFIAEFFRKKGV